MAENLQTLKRQAAEAAVAAAVKSGMVVGLGTGSTAVHMVRALGRLLANGDLQEIVGLPTSEATAAEAQKCGVPLTDFDHHPIIDVTIDGADEVDPNLDLIKGLGGALLREKIVATASKKMIIVGDYTKSVTKLGTQAPVPVEVIPFAQRPVTDYLSSLGARVVLREQDGTPYRTDENNIILDCHFEAGIDNPRALARALITRPGIVEHGLFLNLANEVFLAREDQIDHRVK